MKAHATDARDNRGSMRMMSEVNALMNFRNAMLAQNVGIRVAKMAGDSQKQVAAALIELLETVQPGTPSEDAGGVVDTYA